MADFMYYWFCKPACCGGERCPPFNEPVGTSWDHGGQAGEQRDHHTLCLTSKGQKVKTRDGFWINKDIYSVVYSSSRGLKGLFGRCVGIRRTYIWSDMGGNKSSWIMNVYSELRGPYVQREYMTMLEDVLFGGPDPHSSMETENSNPRSGVSPTNDHGQSDNHTKKSSDVWDYFTKIHARDLEGNVLTLAICNHCSRALGGSSAGGTSHLARHTCPCKFRPVQAGRMGKG
uniref:Uncharacterized protein n=1 Tax=Avena sativa TaxID=4498 RepID=A0ACD5YJD5_AVESA